jgi:hypothetical protein
MRSQFIDQPFTQEEITDLTAFLEDLAINHSESDEAASATLILFSGLLTAGIILGITGAVIRDQRR